MQCLQYKADEMQKSSSGSMQKAVTFQMGKSCFSVSPGVQARLGQCPTRVYLSDCRNLFYHSSKQFKLMFSTSVEPCVFLRSQRSVTTSQHKQP